MPYKFLILAILLWCSLLLIASNNLYDNNLEIHYLSIGQGDATLIITPQHQKILIDGGPYSNLLPDLGELLPYYDKTIDLLILTHPHADHIDGLIEVLKRYQVQSVLLNPVFYNSAAYQEFLKTIAEQDVNFVIAHNKFDLMSGKEFKIDLMFPFDDCSFKEFKNVNDSSVVLKLTYGANSFLFTGDAEIEVEDLILKSKQELESDYFQAGHHGSKTANSQEFLKSANPELVIISSGQDNKFDHPHQETLDSLEELEIEYLDLKETGRLSLECDLLECEQSF